MKTQFFVCLILGFVPLFLMAQINGYNPKALEKAEATIAAFNEKDSKFETYFNEAFGYVVFPSIAKGASGIGAAHGAGTAFEQGKPIGKAKMTQITFGLQFGGQAYSLIIFFETEADLHRFKENKFEFAAQASAVAIKEGATSNLAYRDGVAVFTMTKAGLMYEASLGGQKLKFKAFNPES
jgi:lipid-binding SYLF domain-containing protein